MKNINMAIFAHVTAKEKVFFSRQLAVMISAGLAIDNAINIISRQTKNQAFIKVLNAIYQDIEAGEYLSVALSKHPKVFDKVFVSVVKSGEASGKLDKVLTHLADQMEIYQSFQSSIRSALAYPIFVVSAMIVVVVIMMVKVVPVLKTVFEDVGAELPWTTRSIIALSNFMVEKWWLILLVLLVLIFGLWAYFRHTKKGRFQWDVLKLKTPLVAYLAYDIYMARFARTLGMLIESGVPIIDALKITATALANRVFIRILKNVISQVERGVPMSVPLSEAKEIPILVSQMIMVGEQTGKLETLMDKLADYYEKEVSIKIKTIVSLIEPVIIVIVGLGVGFVIYSILYPIYSIAQLDL